MLVHDVRIDRRAFLVGIGWIATTDYLLANQAVLLNQINPKADAGGLHIQAEYEITAEWSVDIDADVDLHVIAPDGKNGTDVYYSMKDFRGIVTLDHDCRGFPDNFYKLPDGTIVKNPVSKEMTTIRGKLPGRYDVGVHYYRFGATEDHSKPDVSVTVEVVKLNPTTKVKFTKQVTLTYEKQTINVVSFDLDLAGEYFDAPLPLAWVTDHVMRPGG
jgi:hypothetical protein